ncbi:MAG: aminotransferase class I/II-fold pyridoxal phosphate-dependent enzyme [Candidatus Kerfeldbacteria bacterium]|nr:aminotransferase class I/II-fold pyridoxal phosphate-dependent enzyme [Candidatus Kerfeldbacteria bacterium]
MTQLVLNRNEVFQTPAPGVLRAIRRFRVDHVQRYLDNYGRSILVPKLSRRFRVSPDRILLTYGEEDLFRTVVSTLRPGKDALLTHDYHYSYLDQYLRPQRIALRTFRMRETDNAFQFDISDCLRKYRKTRPNVLLLASPSNPTGTSITARDLRVILDHIGQRTLVMVDEVNWGFDPAYDEPGFHSLLRQFPNLLIARSFSKRYAMAGLRIGFALCGSGVRGLLRFQDRYLGVSRILEEAAVAALDAEAYYSRVSRAVMGDRAWFVRSVRTLGVQAFDSTANFVLLRLPTRCIPFVQRVLRREPVLIAKFVRSGLLRVTVGSPPYTRRLVALLRSSIHA